MTVPPPAPAGHAGNRAWTEPNAPLAPAAASAAAGNPFAKEPDDEVEVEEEEDEEDEEADAAAPALRIAPASSASPGRSSRPRPSRPSRGGSLVPAAASSLPPADLNHASVERIRAALPKTSKLADAIVAERESNGAFRSFHDLKVRVRGLGAAKVKLLQQAGLSIALGQAPVQPQPQPQQPQAHIDSSLFAPAAPATSTDRSHAAGQDAVVRVSSAPAVAEPLLLPAVTSVPVSSNTPPPPAAELMVSPARPQAGTADSSTTTTSSCWCSWLCCSCINHSPAKAPADSKASTHTTTTSAHLELTSITVASQSTPVATPPLASTCDIEQQLANMSIGPSPAPVPPVPAHSAIPAPSRSSPTLRVGSWNLCHFSTTKAHQRVTLSVVADLLIRQRFDVMVLLEVRSDEACQMLLAELNNPHRQLPIVGAHQLPPCDDSGVGQWAYTLSDCVEYGSEAHALPSSSFSSPQQLVLEADIAEERFAADGTLLSSARTHSIAHARSISVAQGDEDVLASMASLSIREETHATGQNGCTIVSSSSSTSTTHVTMSQGFSTPVKKQGRASRALSPPATGQHRRGSMGNSSGSNGSGFTPRRSHKKKEYYSFFYRRDRVELPHGCRLFQTKATPPDQAASPCADADVDVHSWWRSPCYALVRPLPSLLAEFAGASAASSSASSTAAPSSLPLSWLLVALHVIWGDGEADVLHECSHLQHLNCAMVEHANTLAPSVDSNCAVALIGDFNLNANDGDFLRHCLPATHYQALIPPPHATTFSSHRHACNLYDQCFIERRVLDALVTQPSTSSTSASSSSPADATPLPSGVVYFDSTYFPPSDVSDALCAARCRGEAKKLVSDHRPIFVDVPCVGDVRGVASRTPPVRLPPIPVQAPKATPAPSPSSPRAAASPPPSSSADAAPDASTAAIGTADSVPLSSLLSIVLVTSAIPIHPSTEVIDYVVHSFTLVPELRDVPIFIMADAPKQVLPDETAAGATADPNIFKRGVMTQSRFANYRLYLQNLRARYASRPEIHIVELATYSGFAWAVKVALESHVRTPFVLVCQHDYIFTMRVPIRQLVWAMHESQLRADGMSASAASAASAAVPSADAPPGAINYIGFIHKRTQNYLHTMQRNMPPDMRNHPMHRLFRVQPQSQPQPSASSSTAGGDESPLLLCPLLFWYDKQHLASRRYYLDTVLTHPRLTAGPGRFVEDEFGVEQIEDVRAARDGTTMDRWAKYGSYLYYPDQRGVHIALRHIHGRRFEQQPAGGLHRFVAPASDGDAADHSDTDATEACHAIFE